MGNMTDTTAVDISHGQPSVLRSWLLVVWLCVAFGGVFFARDLSWVIAGWPFNFWYASQGAVLAFIAIVVIYAVYLSRLGGGRGDVDDVVGDLEGRTDRIAQAT